MSSLPARMSLNKSKMKELKCSQNFSHYKSMGISRRSRAANSAVLGPILPNFELVRDVMDFLVTCKYEEDPIKNEGARVVTKLYRASDSGSGDPGSILGRVGVFVSLSKRHLLPKSTGNTQE